MLRLAAVLLLAPGPAFAAHSVFRVVSVEGGALTADGKPARPGFPFRDGQALHLDGGRAVLSFGEEGRVLLSGPADLVVEERGASLSFGGLLSVLDRLRGPFSVRTPTAVAAVRGTNFFIEARGKDQTYLCLCSGKIEVSGAGGFKKTIRASRHSPFLFTRGEKGVVQSAAHMENHTDAQIESLRQRR